MVKSHRLLLRFFLFLFSFLINVSLDILVQRDIYSCIVFELSYNMYIALRRQRLVAAMRLVNLGYFFSLYGTMGKN